MEKLINSVRNSTDSRSGKDMTQKAGKEISNGVKIDGFYGEGEKNEK